MPFISSLTEDSGAIAVMKLDMATGAPFADYIAAQLLTNNLLSGEDKELMGAYISKLNNCNYTLGIHKTAFKSFGLDASVIDELLRDIDSSSVSEKLKPVLKFAKALTLSPGSISASDASAVLNAGYSEEEFHNIVMTICLFNFTNRMLDGHGVKGNEKLWEERGKELHNSRYQFMIDAFKDR
jgi:uncharacterized peroxidase-related enzyme